MSRFGLFTHASSFVTCLLSIGFIEPKTNTSGNSGSTHSDLLKAARARNEYQSLRICYLTRQSIPALNVDREMIREDRFVGRDRISWLVGDRDGIQQFGQVGDNPLGRGMSCAPIGELISASTRETWRWIKGENAVGRINAPMPGYVDPRIAGLQPYYGGAVDPDQLIKKWDEFFKKRTSWSKQEKDREIHLTAVIVADDDKRERWEWWIDSSKQHAVTRSTRTILEPDGNETPVTECVTTYKRTQGRWFPEKSTMRLPNGSTPIIVEVLEIEFDSPQMPKQLGPGDLGLPIGLSLYLPTDVPGKREHRKWTGVTFIPADEFRTANPPYDTSELERMQAEARATGNYAYPVWWFDPSNRMGLVDVETTPNLWEDYVRRWCLRYEVDDGQRTAARAILDDCLARARRAMSGISRQAEQIERQLSLLKSGDPAYVVAMEKKNNLYRPVAEIFDELKRRLEQTLREPQRSAPPIKPRQSDQPVKPPPVIVRKPR